MDEHLLKIWTEINERHFASELEPPRDIEWGETSGENGIGAHGVFFDKSRAIAIDEKFKFNEEALRADDQEEFRKVEAAYRLVMHEMVHQALFQRNAPQPGKHGASFLAEAERISKQLGQEPPTAENVHRWPFH